MIVGIVIFLLFVLAVSLPRRRNTRPSEDVARDAEIARLRAELRQ